MNQTSREAEQAVEQSRTHRLADRFRGFLPVVVDVEAGGLTLGPTAVAEAPAPLPAIAH
mgnify:CR=1 FL=1